MKKYILGLMIAGISFITFVSADFTTYFEGNGEGGYEPGLLTINGDYSFSISDLSNYSCVDPDCLLDFINENGDVVCEIGYDQDIILNNGNSCIFSAGEYAIDCPSGDTFGTLTIKFNSISGGNEGGNTGGGTEGGGESGGESGGIVAGGINAFSGIIERLGNIAGEFLPYMIYIAIACLGISLAYKAAKMITRYLVNKNKSVFYYRDYEGKRGRITGYNANGTPRYETIITEKRVRRKKPKRSNFKYFR